MNCFAAQDQRLKEKERLDKSQAARIAELELELSGNIVVLLSPSFVPYVPDRSPISFFDSAKDKESKEAKEAVKTAQEVNQCLTSTATPEAVSGPPAEVRLLQAPDQSLAT